MAKRLSKAGIVDGRLAQAYHVTQSIDAFTGVDAYDITLSGSLVVTGSTNISGTLGIPGFPDVSASLAAADDGFPFTGSAIITGSLIVTGSTNIDGLVTATSFSGDGSNITGVTGEWDGTLDGNAEITGSLILTQNLTASNISASGDLFSNNLTVNGNTIISGSLLVSGSSTFTNIGPAELTGSTNILASEGSNLTLEVNESASFEFLTGAANSGSFIVQTSPDTGKGFLQSYFGQGTGTVFGQPVPNQSFGVTYSTGSSASEGELTMVIGKRDLSNLGAANQNNFYVSYEPGGAFTNAQGELEFYVGEHGDVSTGVLSVFRGGASGTTQTSSYAGYFSSSAFANQQQFTRPFAISATSTVGNSNPAFVINKDITNLTTSNFSVDYGGNVTATGNISASGDIFGVTGSFSHVVGNSPITVGDSITFQQPVTASNISASGQIQTTDIRGTAARNLNIKNVGTISNTTGDPSIMFENDYDVKLGDANEADTGTLIEIDAGNEVITISTAGQLNLPNDVRGSTANSLDIKNVNDIYAATSFPSIAFGSSFGEIDLGDPTEAGNGTTIQISDSNESITLNGRVIASSNQIDFTNLPTSDPGVAGRLYRDASGFVKVSL